MSSPHRPHTAHHRPSGVPAHRWEPRAPGCSAHFFPAGAGVKGVEGGGGGVGGVAARKKEAGAGTEVDRSKRNR